MSNMASPSAISAIPAARSSMAGKIAITPISVVSSPASALSPTPSSGSATPTSGHQVSIKPAGGNIQLSSMASQAAKNSITSKEWVIPPRPKPGRKPATDTPPTKRKAQNRAAQRAFRERRAARVGELEEQLEEQREEHQRIQQELQDRVQGLDTEVRNLRTQCSALEDMLEKERAERLRISSEYESMQRRWKDEATYTTPNSNHDSLPSLMGRHHGLTVSQHPTPRSSIASNHSGHRNSTATFAISQIISPPDSSAKDSAADGCGSCDPNGSCACVEEVLASPSMDCGKCSLGTRCECLQAVLNPSSSSDRDLKRRPSTSTLAPDEKKRQKSNANENEIDFTAMFAKRKQPATAIPPRDKCGFCEEGTYCMCAEAAGAASHTLAPISSQVQTPPPSDNDVGPPPMEVTSTGAIKLPSLQSLNYNRPPATRKSGSRCGPNGPGTCAQCLADPKSGLFCRSLAANFEMKSGVAGQRDPASGCCGGSASGTCCKSNTSTANSSSASTLSPSSGLGVSVSCADAYKTLSSHRNFERAADDIGSWLPKLRAMPHPQDGHGHLRPPIEVETASIMSVLKGFDVRFAREG